MFADLSWPLSPRRTGELDSLERPSRGDGVSPSLRES